MTTAPQQNIKTAIPDLADIPLEQVDELGGNVLAESIALYRERLKKNGVPHLSTPVGMATQGRR